MICGERAGTRTQDLLIKSQLLYRLSYALLPARCVGAAPRGVNRRNRHLAVLLNLRDANSLHRGTGMPIVNRVADFHNDITQWRRDLHAHPELQYDVHRTAATVAEKLKSFGCDEVVPGIGRTGVVGVIRGRKGRLRGDRAARRHGRAADRGGDTGLPTNRPCRARCMPAAMTATPRCCSAPRAILPRRAISPAPRW